MGKYHVLYGLTKRMASIINLDTSEILNVALYTEEGTIESYCKQYVVIGSSLSKYGPCSICIGNEYEFAHVRVDLNEAKDDFEIVIECFTHDLMMDIKIRGDYKIGYNEDYDYVKMLREFKTDGRCRSNDDAVLILIPRGNLNEECTNLTEECMNDEVRN